MVGDILVNQEVEPVCQWRLVTNDAHAVVKKTGFRVTERASDSTEIRKPRANSRHAGIPART